MSAVQRRGEYEKVYGVCICYTLYLLARRQIRQGGRRTVIRFLALIVAAVMFFSFGGCSKRVNIENILEFYDSAVSLISRTQLTNSLLLIGEREYDGDRYVGKYEADCFLDSGRDVIFGGASIYERKIKLTADIETVSGSAKVRIRIGDSAKYYHTDKNGHLELCLTLDSGGSYIMIDYDDFSGKVRLTSEYTK